MTRDEVIRMAREAGFEISCERVAGEAFIQVPLSEWDNSTMLFERFAKLVAQKERESCALVVEDTEVEQFTYCQVLHDDGRATLAAAAKEIRVRGNQ